MVSGVAMGPQRFCASCLCRRLGSKPPGPPRSSVARRRLFASQSPAEQGSAGSPPHPRDAYQPRLADWPSAPNPTPYEVLGLARGAPYSKRHFNHLVKLYHPDRHHQHHQQQQHAAAGTDPPARGPAAATAPLPHGLLLERYHLIIAAHDLLSDPATRHLYDTAGHGWDLHRRTQATYDPHWRSRPGSAARNATWEDWERWHAARGPAAAAAQDTKPMFMSNGAFATLVVLLCMVGSFVQMGRAESEAARFQEAFERKQFSDERELRAMKGLSIGMSREERVERFVRDRENVLYEFMPSRVENPSHRAEHGEGEPGK